MTKKNLKRIKIIIIVIFVLIASTRVYRAPTGYCKFISTGPNQHEQMLVRSYIDLNFVFVVVRRDRLVTIIRDVDVINNAIRKCP